MTINNFVALTQDNAKMLASKKNGAVIEYTLTKENNTQYVFATACVDDIVQLNKIMQDLKQARLTKANASTITIASMQEKVKQATQKAIDDMQDAQTQIATLTAQIEKAQAKLEKARYFASLDENAKRDYLQALATQSQIDIIKASKKANASKPFARDIFANVASAYYLTMRQVQAIYLRGLDGLTTSAIENDIFTKCDDAITNYMTK